MTKVQSQPMTASARDIVERLRDHEISRHHGGCADCYGFVMDDGADEIDRLRAELASARKALEEIKQATIEGQVCDDVAWFDGITTLHDYCDIALNGLDPEQPKFDGPLSKD